MQLSRCRDYRRTRCGWWLRLDRFVVRVSVGLLASSVDRAIRRRRQEAAPRRQANPGRAP